MTDNEFWRALVEGKIPGCGECVIDVGATASGKLEGWEEVPDAPLRIDELAHFSGVESANYEALPRVFRQRLLMLENGKLVCHERRIEKVQTVPRVFARGTLP